MNDLLAWSCVFFFLMIRRPPRSTQSRSSAASDVYKRQVEDQIKTVFVDEVLFGKLEHGGMAMARLENEKIVFDISPKNDS